MSNVELDELLIREATTERLRKLQEATAAFSYRDDHTFTDEERQILQTVARTCEHALTRAQLHLAEADAQRAEAANLRKDEFLAMLGHELRNPLAAMVGALDLLKLREPVLGRELTILDRQVTYLMRIVGDLVDVSRITHGKVKLQRASVDLTTVIDHAIDTAQIDLQPHHVTVSVAPNLVVDADRDRLAQVLTNLLTNAAKYTPRGGRIEVLGDSDGSFARIAVRDNGVGIAPSLLPDLFDMFVQGERAADRHPGGLGVGLTIVRSLVELHGGTVGVHSDGADTGATFTLRWPCATSQTPTAKFPALRKQPKPLRVLVVDHDVDAAAILGEVLRFMGHEPIIVHDGSAALETVESTDVAIVDVGLQVIDGYELAERLRAIPSFKATLVAIADHRVSKDGERAARAGFVQQLAKPIDIDELATILSTVK
jgi:signal transduction histidine kinase/CheY-like chemotaxis protein